MIYFISALIFLSLISSLPIMLFNQEYKHQIIVWTLNITSATATSLGIIAAYRHGLHGLHGKSFLFLTLGLACWFIADFSIMYYYYFEEIEEQKEISLADGFWLSGYVFLCLHLITVAFSLERINVSKTLIIISIFIAGYIIYTVISYDFILVDNQIYGQNTNRSEEVLSLIYPILDLSLMIPSLLILANIFHNYLHSIPWILASLSLLLNAIADNGYVNELANGSHTSWFWDLFYVTDFIIMSGALFWYNKFYISTEKKKRIRK